jgi:hypothetical protein
MYSFFNAFIASSFLSIIRNKDASFNCPAKIETLFIIFPASTLNPARAVDRFFTIFSASAKSLAWRNICYSNS